MTDILDEIREDLQRENFVKILRRYGSAVVAGILLLLLVTAGWGWWQSYREAKDAAVGDNFYKAEQQFAEGKIQEAMAAFDTIIQEKHTGFSALAALQKAALLKSEGKSTEAIAVYDALAANTQIDPALRELAIVLSSTLHLESGSVNDVVESQLSILAEGKGAWKAIALQLKGLIALHKKDYPKSREFFSRLSEDKEAPENMRLQATQVLGVLSTNDKGVKP